MSWAMKCCGKACQKTTRPKPLFPPPHLNRIIPGAVSGMAGKVALRQKNGDPEWIRTTDPQIRNLVLYPTELRDHSTFDINGLAGPIKNNIADALNIIFYRPLYIAHLTCYVLPNTR